MVMYLEDDRNGHLYGKHVVAAIKRVRGLAGKKNEERDMRLLMSGFVGKLSFREMCVVLKEQKGWREARDFFSWMKLQNCALTVKLSSERYCLYDSFANIWASWKDQVS